MPTMTTSLFPLELMKGLDSIITDSSDSRVSHFWKELVREEHTTKAQIAIQINAGLSRIAERTNEGGTISMDSTAPYATLRQSWTKYGHGYTITKEAIEDNQYMNPMIAATKDLRNNVRELQSLEVANLYQNGFNTTGTGYNWADRNEALFGDHANLDGTINNNALAGELTEVILESEIVKTTNWRNYSGAVRQGGTQWNKILIPPARMWDAERLLGKKSTMRIGQASNDVNALVTMGAIDSIMKWEYLENPNQWWLLTAESGADSEYPTFYQRRMPKLETEMTGLNETQTVFYFYRYGLLPTSYRWAQGYAGS